MAPRSVLYITPSGVVAHTSWSTLARDTTAKGEPCCQLTPPSVDLMMLVAALSPTGWGTRYRVRVTGGLRGRRPRSVRLRH